MQIPKYLRGPKRLMVKGAAGSSWIPKGSLALPLSEQHSLALVLGSLYDFAIRHHMQVAEASMANGIKE